jgi:acetyl-CoA decarbonylase/synthase complex subunit gamma
MRYRIEPGLYGVGKPTPESPVLVTANYKMSFDRLRSQLGGRDAWILALETHGINVWCAAGKGTFGTGEIVRRVEIARLKEVVSHRRLILPQLGAPGVRAHEVSGRCGFRIVYGPVRAGDLPAFLDAGMKATAEMRRVRFGFSERVVLIPVELLMGAKYALLIAACLVLLGGLGRGGYSFGRLATTGLWSGVLFLAVFAAGTILTPVLLPWLPGRSFSIKGTWVGLALLLAFAGYAWTRPPMLENGVSVAAWCLIIPAVASFMGMNFTGASTYTSLSGVRREMRVALPIQAVCAVLGAGLWLAAGFF